MKILVVSQYYYPEPLRVHEICEELVKRGHECSVITENPNYPDGYIYEGYDNTNRKEVINGVTVYRVKARPRLKGAFNLALNYISFAVKGIKAVKKLQEKYDVIYVYQLSPITLCFPALYLKKKRKIRVILYCLDIWPESLKGSSFEKGIIFNIFKYISRYIYCNVDKLIVTSPCFIKYISKLCNIPQNDIVFLPQHSVDVEFNGKVNTKNKCSNEIVNFMFLGNIGESQNIECIINSLQFVKNINRIKLHFVGSGSYLDKSIELGEKYIKSKNIIFHGRFPKTMLSKFYAIADVCIVSLKDEGITGYTIPGKVQEYMAAGKPILASISGDTNIEISKAKCGICVPPNDSKRFASAIDYMVEHRFLFDEWGLNARHYYESNYTLNKHIDKLEKILLEEVMKI